MDNRGQGSGMPFEEASKRFMDIFDEPGSIVQPVGAKLILKGHEIPAGTGTPEEYQKGSMSGAETKRLFLLSRGKSGRRRGRQPARTRDAAIGV